MTRHRSQLVAASVVMLVAARAAVALAAPAVAPTPTPATPAAPASAPVAAAVAPTAPIPVTGSIAGGDQGRSGSTTQPGPERPPAVVWSQPVAPNAVTEPIVIMSGGKAVVLVGSGEDLLALDARSGAPLWTSDLGMFVGAPPSIAGGRIYAHGLDGILRIINPVTGATIREIEEDFILTSAGLALGDLYIHEETSMGGGPAKSRLHATDLATHFDRWRADYTSGAGRAPSTDGERVYVACNDAVRAFLATDGTPAWTRAHDPMSRTYAPIVRDGRVIASRGGFGPGIIEALDAATGKVLWSKETVARLAAAPSVVDGEIIVPLMNSTLARFKAADGAELPAVKVPGRVDVQLVVAPRRIYFAAGKMFGAIDRATMQVAWRLDSSGEIATLAVDGGTLFVGRQDGFLDAVESAPAP